MIDLTKETFDKEVNQSSLPVMVDFWAPWCGPCKQLMPLLKQHEDTYKDKVKFAKVNIDDNPELATQFNVMAIPTVCFFKNGQLVDTLIGMRPGVLKQRLDNL